MTQSELLSIRGIGPATAREVVTFNEWDRVDAVLEQTERIGASIITYRDEDYPPLLRQIYDPPAFFWLKGDSGALKNSCLSIVGTRRASRYGKQMTRNFTRELVERGYTIVSGLAYGIDSVAHGTTVRHGGLTVAVLGSGIDTIYPEQNKQLARDIVESGGAIISEFPPGTIPEAGNFPVRNRIVSGMSVGTLVVESGREGGSMITARSALDQNREVFVVPHALDTNGGLGCNYLIKTGQGKLVQEIDDIMDEIPEFRIPGEKITTKPGKKNWKDCELDETERAICQLLEHSSRHLDEISIQLNLPSHVLLSRLLQLEMKKCVRQTAGKYFELV